MPQYSYRGRDKEGRLRTGERFADNLDLLNNDLNKEGIYPISIKSIEAKESLGLKISDWFQKGKKQTSELTIFARQMQLLHDAGVPIIVGLKQLAIHARTRQLRIALDGIIDNLERGQTLARSMQNYPEVFTPMMVNIVQIGETTGRLGEAFAYIHQYLEFETSTIRQLRTAFRYPMFVLIAVACAIIVLNVFVIPSFATFYSNLNVPLPWQTRILIWMSNLFVYYGIYLLIGLGIIAYFIYRYLSSPKGKLAWHHFLLRMPVFGRLLNRILIIRFAQSLSIILKSGLSATQGLKLVKNTMTNEYIAKQIEKAQEDVERGVSFTNAISKIELFSPLEIQILNVGERNGELSPALSYIANLHSQEIEYELKRVNDFIGPALIAIIAVLVLIIALGVYLPIWNMINLTKT